MIASGFVLLCVVYAMSIIDDPLFGDRTPGWYAAIGVLLCASGFFSMVAGLAQILWRVMP
ncbi:hypothetical protein CBA19CS22_38050 [Caballeronia novacaledonica]|uniref:Uncharacterized protein n=1 Tax=Caballeronia novacaledonica TaxID=1544861 RepID=A0ACB5R622_9BURK|nr:hypothetical protein CBA19CS22_38050 [Caballeronia novacaledonica]